jgi:histidine ammonia-lyase
VIENTARVLALELACGAQALDLHGVESGSPAARATWAAVREDVPFVIRDRGLSDQIGALSTRVMAGEIVTAAERGLGAVLT